MRVRPLWESKAPATIFLNVIDFFIPLHKPTHPQPTSLFSFFHVLHNILINLHQFVWILNNIINNNYQSVCVLVLFHSQTPWQLSQRRSSLILTLVLVSHLISFHSIPFSSKYVSLDLVVSGYPRYLHFIGFICIF